MKAPSSQVTLGILPTMAPPHFAWLPFTTFGLTLKVFSQAKVGLDAEEGLAHDDKCRDIEDEIWSQIMEVQAVVIHEPPDEGVEWEAQSAEEVGEEYDPLTRPGGGDELPLVGQPVRDVAGEVSSVAQLFDVLLLNGGGSHLPPAPDMVGDGRGEMHGLGRWSSRVRGDG